MLRFGRIGFRDRMRGINARRVDMCGSLFRRPLVLLLESQSGSYLRHQIRNQIRVLLWIVFVVHAWNISFSGSLVPLFPCSRLFSAILSWAFLCSLAQLLPCRSRSLSSALVSFGEVIPAHDLSRTTQRNEEYARFSSRGLAGKSASFAWRKDGANDEFPAYLPCACGIRMILYIMSHGRASTLESAPKSSG